MPARDYYHDVVRNAIKKDGWTITHDPESEIQLVIDEAHPESNFLRASTAARLPFSQEVLVKSGSRSKNQQ